jgi:membrane-associated phospholipid phosphatase
MSVARALADPRVRLGAGTAALLVTAMAARRNRVSPGEAVLGAAVLPRLGPGGRAVTLAAVSVVGLTRIYVGAHLPLDVAGGAALGLAIDAAMTLRRDRAGCEHNRPAVSDHAP